MLRTSYIIGKSIGYGFISSLVAYSGAIMVLIANSNYTDERDSIIDIKDKRAKSNI